MLERQTSLYTESYNEHLIRAFMTTPATHNPPQIEPTLSRLRLLPVRRAGFLIGLFCLVLALLFFAPERYSSDARHGWVCVALAALAFGVAMWRLPDTDADSTPQPDPTARSFAPGTLMFGIVGLLIAAQGNIGNNRYEGLFAPHVQMIAFMLGLALVCAGLGGYTWAHIRAGLAWASHFLPQQIEQWSQRNQALLAIIVLAIVVRVVSLEYGLHRLVDEIHFMTAVSDLRNDPNIPVLTQHGSVTAFTWVYPYFQSVLVDVFGAGLSPLRLVSGIFGVAQVVALYALIKAIFDRRTALLAALLLATFPPHVHFSRLGINNIVDQLFGILTLWCLVRGMQTGKSVFYAGGGICLGLTHYFYEGGRLFYTPFVLGWLLWLFVALPRPQRGLLPKRRHLIVFGVGLLLTVAPMYYVWSMFKLPALSRFDSVGGSFYLLERLLLSGEPLRVLWERLQYPLMFFVYTPEGGSFYTGSRMILYETLPFFLMGLIWCFWRMRRIEGGLLFGWVAAQTLAMGLLAGSSSFTTRYCVVFPALVGLLAVGLMQGWRLGLRLWLARPPVALKSRLMLVPIVIGVLIALYQVWAYSTIISPRYYQLQFYNERERDYPVKDFDDALFRVVSLPEGSDAYIISPQIWGGSGFNPFIRYFGRWDNRSLQLRTLKPEELTPAYLQATLPVRTRAFFVEPNDVITIQRLREYFPTLDGPIYSPYPVPIEKQFVLYRVAPQ
jgi:4-amino-4-deoxy-L-arabinose transferase-like glycosyltransferase